MLKNYFKHIMFKDYLIVLSILAMTLLWDFMGYDMTVAHWFGTNTGFALQNNYLLKFVFHEIGQNTARLLFIVLIIMIWRPLGIFKSIHKINRIQMVFSVLLTSTSVTLIKHFSQTSCPWSLSAFGGVVPYISHWQWNINTPQSGHCFPGGHASSGFAFIAASFWFRDYSLRLSRWVWWLSSLIGLIFGWTQQMRGAHFFSHTLWSWVICASVGLIYFYTTKKAKY
jgi:membrane-associated PAP2 superfamily phosphatase